MGQLMTSFRSQDDKAWNYVRPVNDISPYLYFKPNGDDLFELVVLDGWKSKVASNSDDPPNSFHTSDLFTPHPTIPNAWKYISRSDDRITLVNGEKVLPVPFENQLRKDPLIREALLFGVGKALPGLLIVPSEKAMQMTSKQLIDAIWPTIALANSKAEGFGQISKEMVEILPADVEYPATDKGTIIRAASYRHFASIIQRVYKRFEGEEIETGEEKMQQDQTGLETFILAAVKDKTQKVLKPDDDFFNAGIDSLQAITIRAFLKRKLDVGNAQIGANVIFEHPNARDLAAHLHSLRTGIEQTKESEIDVMQRLITKYSHFEKHQPRTSQCVLLTGTTGSLGAHILARLLSMEHVITVFCPVRASSPSAALDRILTTLSNKGLVPFANVDKIVALPADLSRTDLGFPPSVTANLKASLTTVIHSAWAVNFNLGVSTFEKQHIAGVSNLINLCLAVNQPQPARFFFCSSISAAAGTPLPATVPEGHIPQLEYAQNMGYARSKLVAERIVRAAAENTGMVAKVLRIGQIVGDVQKGIWNATEAIPLMIQSAVSMGALPELDEVRSRYPLTPTSL
jgi:nucleoside-diphosphate-sugar epimerase/acyl carrier protein